MALWKLDSPDLGGSARGNREFSPISPKFILEQSLGAHLSISSDAGEMYTHGETLEIFSDWLEWCIDQLPDINEMPQSAIRVLRGDPTLRQQAIADMSREIDIYDGSGTGRILLRYINTMPPGNSYGVFWCAELAHDCVVRTCTHGLPPLESLPASAQADEAQVRRNRCAAEHNRLLANLEGRLSYAVD